MNSLTNHLISQKPLIRLLFIQFLIDELYKNIFLNKSIHKALLQIFQDDTNIIKTKFQQKYSTILSIQNSSKFNLSPNFIFYKSSINKKLNIDLLLKLHLKPKIQPHTKYTLSYSFQLSKYSPKSNKPHTSRSYNKNKPLQPTKKQSKKYFWKVQFEYIGQENEQKTIWVYKDLNRQKQCESDNQNLLNQFIREENENDTFYLMDCFPVRKGQILLMKIPYCVRNNILPTESLQFYPLEQQTTQLSTIQKFFSKKTIPTLCPIQTLYQWKPYNYYNNPISFQLDDLINCYKKQLHLQSIQINEPENHYKILLRCKNMILKPKLFMGYFIEILPKKVFKKMSQIGNILHKNTQRFKKIKQFQHQQQPINIQLKRKGIYQQNKRKLTFRLEDKLIIYLPIAKDE